MKSIYLLFGGLVLAPAAFADSLFLEASDYNVFVRSGFTGLNSDVQGKIAAGGNFSVQNYAVGSSLSGSVGNSLLVGGDFSFSNGQVYNGNVMTSDTTPNTPGMTVLNGTFQSGVALPIYIPTLMTELVARSGYLGSLSSNGTTNLSFGTLTLSGGTGTTRIYTVTAAQLSSATSVVINAPAGTTALINVNGSTASFQNAGCSLQGGITGSTVLFNFWNATSLNFGGIGMQGSVFAPQANVSFSNGNIEGQLIANSFNGGGEMHLSPFSGTVPVPEPASMAALAIGLGALIRRRRK